jgi:S-methylmethionine-dependent homocysteine/selenocysteine methylase
VLRLDGATGTELQRRGIPVRPPWWTSGVLRTDRGLAVLAAIHADYVAAGARVLTANTFRCNLRTLRRAGLDATRAAKLVRRAVGAARAWAGTGVRVVGSIGPVEDCYRPDLVPEERILRAEHGWLARELVAAGVRTVLVETMNRIVEARTAVAAVTAAGGRAWVSFVTGPGARLLSGEPLADAVTAVEREGAGAVLVNCASLADIEAALRVTGRVARGPIGAYPNLEDRSGIPAATHVDRHLPALVGPGEFADAVARWVDRYGIQLAGGCCGTTPAHIAALSMNFKK